MCGSSPEPLVVTKSAGIGEPGFSALNFSTSAEIRSISLGFVGPRFDPPNEAASYPLPAADEVHLWLQTESNAAQLRVYDAHGKLVISELITSQTVDIERNGLPAGIYHAIVLDAENKVKGTAKIIFS